jgi:hypothetical protein
MILIIVVLYFHKLLFLTLFRLKSLEATTGYLPINCLPFMRGNSKLLVLYSSEFFGRYLIGVVVNLFSFKYKIRIFKLK